jgi:hypothetical protein
MSIGLKSDSSGTSGSIVINGSDAVLVTPTGITTASIQDSSITTAKIADANITFGKLSTSATEADNVAKRTAKVWVNFNGTGTVAIRASFNVSSITDNDTGDYVINFTTAIVDANYAALYTNNSTAYVTDLRDYTTISVRTLIDGSVADASINSVAVFR